MNGPMPRRTIRFLCQFLDRCGMTPRWFPFSLLKWLGLFSMLVLLAAINLFPWMDPELGNGTGTLQIAMLLVAWTGYIRVMAINTIRDQHVHGSYDDLPSLPHAQFQQLKSAAAIRFGVFLSLAGLLQLLVGEGVIDWTERCSVAVFDVVLSIAFFLLNRGN